MVVSERFRMVPISWQLNPLESNSKTSSSLLVSMIFPDLVKSCLIRVRGNLLPEILRKLKKIPRFCQKPLKMAKKSSEKRIDMYFLIG